jgi:hypothetical protein
MRLFSGLACAAACAAASAAQAQSARPSQADDAIGSAHALFGAVFAPPASPDAKVRKLNSGASSTLAVRQDDDAAAAAGGAFAMPAYSGTAADASALLTTDRYLSGEGLVRWRTGETMLNSEGGAYDSLRLSVGGVARSPIGVEASDEAFDLTYTRGWLSALRGRSGGLVFDVTPHAGLGVTNAGGSAQMGAVLRVAEVDFGDRVLGRLSDMGVPMVTDGERFGDRGRWYLYAAGSGRAVGLNMLRGPTGWSREGLSTDEGAFIGEAQVGLGWRKGAMQASFGVLAREIKHKPAEGLDEAQLEDQAVAFTLSIKPR